MGGKDGFGSPKKGAGKKTLSPVVQKKSPVRGPRSPKKSPVRGPRSPKRPSADAPRSPKETVTRKGNSPKMVPMESRRNVSGGVNPKSTLLPSQSADPPTGLRRIPDQVGGSSGSGRRPLSPYQQLAADPDVPACFEDVEQLQRAIAEEVIEIRLTHKEEMSLLEETCEKIRSRKRELFLQRAAARWFSQREKCAGKIARGLAKQVSHLRVEGRLKEREAKLAAAEIRR